MCYQPIQVRIKDKEMLVNCRRCFECRQQRAKEWSLRCMFESEDYNECCFITLTYEKSTVHLVKEDLQKFIKRLRKEIYPKKIRYFACGEYGDLRYRPHFHILIFGHDFPDKYPERKSDKGYWIYNSPTLERVWGKGLTTVQEVTKNSSAYCALYASEGKRALPKHLWNYPEFNTMSLGLGVKQMLRKIDTYLQTDEIYFDGVGHNIPQCVLNKKFSDIDRIISRQYNELKMRRVEKSKNYIADYYAHNGIQSDMYTHKKILAENKKNRLTKNLDRCKNVNKGLNSAQKL